MAGKHIYDVMLELEGIRKKPAIFLRNELKYYALKFLKENEMDIKRVYVKNIIPHRYHR